LDEPLTGHSDSGDNGQGDKPGDEAVFDCGGAGLVAEKLPKHFILSRKSNEIGVARPSCHQDNQKRKIARLLELRPGQEGVIRMRVNVIVEAVEHDNSNSCPDADQADESSSSLVVDYDSRNGISIREAIEWANEQRCPVTLYIYDADDETSSTHFQAVGARFSGDR
jgi:hypothetical protein